jgi:hypothetical protein
MSLLTIADISFCEIDNVDGNQVTGGDSRTTIIGTTSYSPNSSWSYKAGWGYEATSPLQGGDGSYQTTSATAFASAFSYKGNTSVSTGVGIGV